MPTTRELKDMLFDDRWHRQFFIEEFIVLDESEHAMPWELDEQRPDLGAVHVLADEPFDVFDTPAIFAEALFVDRSTLEAKRDQAYAWAREIGARDILPLIVSYTLTSDGRDFATLERLALPWVPDEIAPGMRIDYSGIAYPLPGARGIALTTSGTHEIVDMIHDGTQVWFAIQHETTGECLHISEPLMSAAAFLPA
jgi:hypothetical protein